MKVVVLVPWRGGEVTRERNWAITRQWLEALGYPIFTGDAEGPWSRAAACNAAARAAGEWDVAIICDADTIPQTAPIRSAVRWALDTQGAIRPHHRLWNLNRAGSTILARVGPTDYPGVFRSLTHSRGAWLGGGILVIERSAWEKVGGYDESFVGWGHEDTALNIRLLVEADWNRIAGHAWHLLHRREDHPTPERKANRARMDALHAEFAAEIEAASVEKGFDVGAVL